jgi:hypothetical protein
VDVPEGHYELYEDERINRQAWKVELAFSKQPMMKTGGNTITF